MELWPPGDNMRTEIKYEDRDLLVVRKSAGLASQTSKVGQPDVVSELKNYLSAQFFGKGPLPGTAVSKACRQEPFLGVVHRLDQPVEGLLVFAKNKKAAADLSAQLQCREGADVLNKRYYAVLCADPPEDAGELIDYLYKDRTGRAMVLDPPDYGRFPQAQKAILEFCVLRKAAIPGVQQQNREGLPKMLTLVDIRIETGRFHQIRAQMAHAGLPLLGDMKYGSELSIALSRRLGIKNTALCAYSLEFLHPSTKERMRFQTEPAGEAFRLFFDVQTDFREPVLPESCGK